MTDTAETYENRSSAGQILEHLLACDGDFVSPLSARSDLEAYAEKIADNAVRLEAWVSGKLVALVAGYCDGPRAGFITNVSVLGSHRRQGLASRLIAEFADHARARGLARIELEVHPQDAVALALYRKHGFVVEAVRGETTLMHLSLVQDVQGPRDYDREIRDAAGHRYAYDFDFDVMHPFMIRSFRPLFRPGRALELGSFKGDFTARLISEFEDVTCVEASHQAVEDARGKLGGRAKFVCSTFESAALDGHYDTVVMTHVLEHLDDPVGILRRIGQEWLAKDGRLFLACPNANAASRQIAVKMGLISHTTAVTPAEAEHGHRRTYTLEDLEQEAAAAGLKVVHKSGIFFKALANFQWDRILKTDIVSKEYLEGCYLLGQEYPDLCASIFVVCEPG